jgi:ribosomal protein S18 acetylase RimI-like enzyme
MIIVPATISDVDEIAAIVNAAYRREGIQASWTNESALLSGQRIDPAVLQKTITEGKSTILLLRDQGTVKLLGCVSLELLDASTWLLSMLAIDPERQTAGLGRTLMNEAEKYVRARGGTKMEITVIQLRDSLIAWYERRGYRRTGETEPFPYGDDSVGVPLRDDLHFVVLEKRL